MPGDKAPQWLSFIFGSNFVTCIHSHRWAAAKFINNFYAFHWFQARTSRWQSLKWSNSFLAGSPSADVAGCPKLYCFRTFVESIQ